MTPKEKSEEAQRLLAHYIRETKHYVSTWGIPPDRTTHLNAWASARSTHFEAGRILPKVRSY